LTVINQIVFLVFKKRNKIIYNFYYTKKNKVHYSYYDGWFELSQSSGIKYSISKIKLATKPRMIRRRLHTKEFFF